MTDNIGEKANEKPVNEVSKFRKVMAHLWVLSALILMPEIAMANPIADGLDWLLNLLTDGLARSAAILACVVMGYLAWIGNISGAIVGRFIAGVVFVFGGAAIVDLIISAVS